MDLLALLNIDDLPEQQTRIQTLFGSDPGFDKKLGFDACCACGKASVKYECQSCHRVKYCSKKCRDKDSSPHEISDHDDDDDDYDAGGGGEQALGHSSVICALLALCNDDEAIDVGNKTEISSFSTERRTAATDRVISEFESYPATLANVLMEAPCYQEALENSKGSRLTIHVIGASTDSELWEGHPDKKKENKVFGSYADALAEVSERFKMKSIVLQFFGPQCPKINLNETIEIPPIQAKKSTTKLKVTTSNVDYDGRTAKNDNQLKPDILVFFNPGFTCPDYAWEETLFSCMKTKKCPFLVTTNTEMEALADMQFLYHRELFQDIPETLKLMLESNGDGMLPEGDEDDYGGGADGGDADTNTFFSLNPYCGLRVRQSGTMANDLYVKSRWIFGGFSGPKKEGMQQSKKEESEATSEGKRKRVGGARANNKRANPALV